MSRVTVAVQEVKRYLNEYNVKDINFHQILHQLNAAQGDIALKEDVLETSIEISLVSGTAVYDFVFNSTNDLEEVVPQDIIKRVKSVQYPQHWVKPIFPVDQEFDEIKSRYLTLDYVQYVIIRNKQIEFFGIPGDQDEDETFTLQCYLIKPTQDANDNPTTPIDFELPQYFDEALHFYAASKLLPLESQGRAILWDMYEKEVGEKAGVYNHKHNYVRSPKPNW